MARERDAVVVWRGAPSLIVSDHGSAFARNAMLAWAGTIETVAFHCPRQVDAEPNGEAFEGYMRNKLLNETVFYDLDLDLDLDHARATLARRTKPTATASAPCSSASRCLRS